MNKKTDRGNDCLGQNEWSHSIAPLKVIDMKEGAYLAGGHAQAAEEILISLVKSFPIELEQMTAAYQNKNFKKLGQLVHQFYSGLCYCGVPRLRLVTQYLQEAIHGQDPEKINALYFSFAVEIEALMNAVPVLP